MKFIATIIAVLTVNIIYSQSYQDFFTSEKKQDTCLLKLDFKNTNYVFDSEYFNDFNVGHTLLGYFVKPVVKYKPFEKVSFHGGIFIQSYFGEKTLTKFKPIFAINYKSGKNTNIIFGNLYGTVNHDLPEPVFNTEFYITDNIENGLQILYSGNRLKTDFWIDWEQFIFNDSEFPEIFTAGLTNNISLFKYDKSNFALKLSGTATHTGGQIDNRGVPVETLANSVSGFDYNIHFNSSIIKGIRLYSYYITSFDASPEKNLPYLYGFGVLSGFETYNNVISFQAQHWYGNFYFSKKGNPVFQSVSQVNKSFKENQRALVMTKTFFHKNIYRSVKLGLGFDTYYDLYNLSLDFTFGFYIKTNLNYIIKK